MEKLNLDSDSPMRGDFKRDVDAQTPVRWTGEGPRQFVCVCVCMFGGHCSKSILVAVG